MAAGEPETIHGTCSKCGVPVVTGPGCPRPDLCYGHYLEDWGALTVPARETP